MFLQALQALGLALDEYFHLLLPSLVRLLPISNSAMAPMPTRLLVLNAMSHLLPRMHLSAYASAVLHPLISTLSSPSEPLQEAALDTICSVAVAIGPDTVLFLPTIEDVRFFLSFFLFHICCLVGSTLHILSYW